MARKPYVPPMTNNQFLSAAENIITNIGGNNVQLSVKEFSTGSVGWSYNGPLHIQVGNVLVKVMGNLNLTVAGSKPVQDAA